MGFFLHQPTVSLELLAMARIFAAALLGTFIGVERSLAGKHAGMRTYALVAMGSALFVVISEFLPILGYGAGLDPSRITAAVVMGIGFIGSGLALFSGDAGHRGEITTAAGIWVAASVGIACGFGLYVLAAAATVLAIFIFTVLMRLEISAERRFPERGVETLK